MQRPYQKYNREQSGTSPYKRTHVGKNAVAGGIEAGYNVFSQIRKLRESGDKLYLFGRYEYYDSYVPVKGATKIFVDRPPTYGNRR